MRNVLLGVVVASLGKYFLKIRINRNNEKQLTKREKLARTCQHDSNTNLTNKSN